MTFWPSKRGGPLCWTPLFDTTALPFLCPIFGQEVVLCPDCLCCFCGVRLLPAPGPIKPRPLQTLSAKGGRDSSRRRSRVTQLLQPSPHSPERCLLSIDCLLIMRDNLTETQRTLPISRGGEDSTSKGHTVTLARNLQCFKCQLPPPNSKSLTPRFGTSSIFF